MTYVKIKSGEFFESAYRRYKKSCEKSSVFSELKKREYYEKPGVKKRKKSAVARKRAMKRMRRFD